MPSYRFNQKYQTKATSSVYDSLNTIKYSRYSVVTVLPNSPTNVFINLYKVNEKWTIIINGNIIEDTNSNEPLFTLEELQIMVKDEKVPDGIDLHQVNEALGPEFFNAKWEKSELQTIRFIIHVTIM